MVDGRERTYRLYVPASLPPGSAPAPLFIGLHGGGGWGDQFASTSGVEGLAESNGFIVVHPDGVTLAGGQGGVWNGGICCARAVRENVDDVAFIDALITRLATELGVDPRRTYAFGHSNGAIMSFRLACELSDRIVGIGAVAGLLGVEPCAPSQPVSLIQIHGTLDRNIPLAGGVGQESTVGVDFPPPHDGAAAIAVIDGCATSDLTADGDIATDSYESCAAGSGVEFVTITSANHAWPGATQVATRSVGPGYAGYDATAAIVEFLLAHPRP